MRFADIHSHILFGVDDGAKTEDEMYDMLDCAYCSGVRVLCATPHYNPEMFPHPPEAESEAFRKLVAYSEARYSDLRILKGNEIFVCYDVPSIVSEQRRGTISDSEYVLVEFYPDRTARQCNATVQQMTQLGYTAVLAHIERYRALKTKDIAVLKELGAVITVNAESVVGKNGRSKQKHVTKLIDDGLADIITSDAHSKETFEILPETYKYVSERFGNQVADTLMFDNPQSLL